MNHIGEFCLVLMQGLVIGVVLAVVGGDAGLIATILLAATVGLVGFVIEFREQLQRLETGLT